MASRSLAYRKLPRRGVPHFMGRATVLARPRAESRNLWKSFSITESIVGGALPVVLTQQGPQWCWAAVSQAVLALDHNQQTQQQIVNRHTGKNCPITSLSSHTSGNCTAAHGCALKCDDPHDLRLAMSGWGLTLENVFIPAHANALTLLRTELAMRPVAARVQFGGGEAHFILIVACGLGDDPVVRYLSPIFSEFAPTPVSLNNPVTWSEFNRNFEVNRGRARLSHIYPRL